MRPRCSSLERICWCASALRRRASSCPWRRSSRCAPARAACCSGGTGPPTCWAAGSPASASPRARRGSTSRSRASRRAPTSTATALLLRRRRQLQQWRHAARHLRHLSVPLLRELVLDQRRRDAAREHLVCARLRFRFGRDRLGATRRLDRVALRLKGVLLQLVLRRERLLLHHVLLIDRLHHRLGSAQLVDRELLYLEAVGREALRDQATSTVRRFRLLWPDDVRHRLGAEHFLERLPNRLLHETVRDLVDVRPERGVELRRLRRIELERERYVQRHGLPLDAVDVDLVVVPRAFVAPF